MSAEDQICRFYETCLAAIAALDRRYYLTPSPTPADRAAYAARQAELESLRARLYAPNLLGAAILGFFGSDAADR